MIPGIIFNFQIHAEETAIRSSVYDKPTIINLLPGTDTRKQNVRIYVRNVYFVNIETVDFSFDKHSGPTAFFKYHRDTAIYKIVFRVCVGGNYFLLSYICQMYCTNGIEVKNLSPSFFS